MTSRLLASLPADTLAQLRPYLTEVTIRYGDVLYAPGVATRHAYFPSSSVVCLQVATREGDSIEIAAVGTDGVVGIGPLLGGDAPAHHAVVQVEGRALRIEAVALAKFLESSPAFRRSLLRYAHALMTQIGQVAVCNSAHSLQQRVGRWLLVCRDRLGSIDIPATQGVLARLLGVRRESVCHVATALQDAGLVHYVRGRVQIVDPVRLEAAVCECHGVIQRQYARLLDQPSGGPIRVH